MGSQISSRCNAAAAAAAAGGYLSSLGLVIPKCNMSFWSWPGEKERESEDEREIIRNELALKHQQQQQQDQASAAFLKNMITIDCNQSPIKTSSTPGLSELLFGTEPRCCVWLFENPGFSSRPETRPDLFLIPKNWENETERDRECKKMKNSFKNIELQQQTWSRPAIKKLPFVFK